MIRYEIDGEPCFVLTQKDFYPPEDDRCYESRLDYVLEEDDYYNYAKAFWSCYGEDLYDDPLSYSF